MADTADTSLPGRVRRGYALGSVATGTFGTVPGLLLLPYLTDELGIAAGLAGLMVFVPKAWDVFLNPVAGRVSDRSHHRDGRRRAFLLRAGVPLALTFALIFAGPHTPTWVAGTWVVVMFVACASAYAFFQVPYVAMPAEMTPDYGERTRLMTWRVVVLALAILLSGATAPMVVDAVGDAQGYRAMGVYVGLILLVGATGAYLGTRGAPSLGGTSPVGTLREQLALVTRVADFRNLLITFVVQALGVAAILAGVAYVADDLLDSSAASTLLFVAFVGPALLCTPLWERYARRRGKRRGYTVSTVFLVVGAVAMLSARSGDATWVYLAAAVVGIGYAGAQVFPMAMLPDVAAEHAERTGENRTGVFTGVWTAGETFGLALGPQVFALVLALGGYVSSRSGTDVVQPRSALDAIAIGFSVVPALIIGASLLWLRRYRLDDRLREPAEAPTDERERA